MLTAYLILPIRLTAGIAQRRYWQGAEAGTARGSPVRGDRPATAGRRRLDGLEMPRTLRG